MKILLKHVQIIVPLEMSAQHCKQQTNRHCKQQTPCDHVVVDLQYRGYFLLMWYPAVTGGKRFCLMCDKFTLLYDNRYRKIIQQEKIKLYDL